MDFLKEIKIKILPLLGKGMALVLFFLIGYFLFYFAVFSRNPLAFLGLVLVILFCLFFLEYAIYIFVLSLPLTSQLPKLLNLPLFSPSELLFLCILNVCLLRIVFDKKKIVLFENPLDLPIIISCFIVIGSFLSTFITHYPLDFFYKEKVLSILKRMLFIRNPYDYSYIFTSTFMLLEGILLFFFVTNFIREKKVLSRVYFLLILGWGMAIILGILQYFGRMLAYERYPMMLFSMFDNPNLFGGYLVLIFPLGILYGINKPFFKRITLLIFAILSIVSLILSKSLNSWISFAVLLVFMGIFFSNYLLRTEKLQFSFKILNWEWFRTVTICIILILGFFLVYLMSGIVLKLIMGEDPSRISMWKYSIQIVEDFPFFGVGIGEFNFALSKYCAYNYIWLTEGHFHPHNYFLLISTELGLIGLYAFLWILGIIFIKGLQLIKGKQDFVKVGIWFGIVGFVLTFFGDGYLWNIEMQFMFWLFIGLLFVDEEGNEITQTHQKPFNKKLFIGLSIIILLTIPVQVYQRSQISFLQEKNIGLYEEKFKDGKREYQWGEKVVLIPLEIKGTSVNIPIKLGNPDIKEKPVKVKVFINKKMVDRLEFIDNDWHILRYAVENTKGNEIPLKIEVSRTWNPYLMGVRHETRDLGPAIGKIYWSS